MLISFGVIKLVALIILVLQVLLALFNYRSVFKSALRKDFLLSSFTSPVELLETYSRVYHPLQLKVNAEISTPAAWQGDMLLINRDWVYQHRALPNIWILNLLSSQAFRHSIPRLQIVQRVLFAVTLFSLFLSTQEYDTQRLEFVVIVTIVLQLAALLIAFWIGLIREKINSGVLLLSADLLNADETELPRIKYMLESWSGLGWVYPIEMLKVMVNFFSPL